MLITFTCNAYENITYLGDVALRLIQLMGHSGTVPGAILAKDVPAALMQLQRGIGQRTEQEPESDDADKEPEISLLHRAIPLIHLLQAAAKAECDVLWSA